MNKNLVKLFTGVSFSSNVVINAFVWSSLSRDLATRNRTVVCSMNISLAEKKSLHFVNSRGLDDITELVL